MIVLYIQVSSFAKYIQSPLHCKTIISIEAPPLAPTNLSTTQLSNGQSTTTVNLTWSQSDSCYVQMYCVEVTATNINFTNMTTSQNIILMLQIGLVYFFRVRGADSY